VGKIRMKPTILALIITSIATLVATALAGQNLSALKQDEQTLSVDVELVNS